MKKLLVVLSALAMFSSSATADIVIFRSGGAKEGIIVEETPATVKLRIKNAVVGFSRANIERIERATSEENKRLDRKWKDQAEEEEEKLRLKREEKKLFEEKQSARGLVKDGNQWTTKRRKAERDKASMRRAVDAQRAAARAGPDTEEEEEPEPEEEKEGDEALEEWEEENNPNARDISKIGVGNFELDQSTDNKMMLVGVITNKSEMMAQSIWVEIVLFNKEEKRIYEDVKVMNNLGEGQSRKLSVMISIPRSLIDRYEVRVRNVALRLY
jgi:hypothetical protein